MIQWHREVQQVENIVHFPTFNKNWPWRQPQVKTLHHLGAEIFRTGDECPGWHRYPGAAAQSFQLKGVVRASQM